jgi:HD superfamily phosphohydrolase
VPGENLAEYVVRDAVHSFIPFDLRERQIIDHSAFQRLRRIRQLGLTDLVYPGATHARFEHFLGLCTLAPKCMTQLSISASII